MRYTRLYTDAAGESASSSLRWNLFRVSLRPLYLQHCRRHTSYLYSYRKAVPSRRTRPLRASLFFSLPEKPKFPPVTEKCVILDRAALCLMRIRQEKDMFSASPGIVTCILLLRVYPGKYGQRYARKYQYGCANDATADSAFQRI